MILRCRSFWKGKHMKKYQENPSNSKALIDFLMT